MTNCGGSHSARSCPNEKKGGGLHNEDGTKIRVCSVYHKPGHTKRNCPELSKNTSRETRSPRYRQGAPALPRRRQSLLSC